MPQRCLAPGSAQHTVGAQETSAKRPEKPVIQPRIIFSTLSPDTVGLLCKCVRVRHRLEGSEMGIPFFLRAPNDNGLSHRATRAGTGI